MAADLRTGCRRFANSHLDGVEDHGVCSAGRRAAFAGLSYLFHGLGTSTVHLSNVLGVMLIDIRRNAQSGLASTTSERSRVHGGQRDEYQRQECFGREHGGFRGVPNGESIYPKL